MKQFVVTSVINGSIQDAIISIKKLTDVSKKDPTPWYCKLCICAKLPFSKLNNTEFACLIQNRTIIHQKQIQESLSLLEKLNQVCENENLSCKYYNKQLKELISDKNNS